MFSSIPMIVKLLMEFGIAFIYFFIFNKCYHIIINDIYKTMVEVHASDSYTLLKYASYIVFFFVCMIFILMNTSTTNRFFVLLEFVILICLFIYIKSSLKLMDTFIYLLYRPRFLKEEEYTSMVGELDLTGSGFDKLSDTEVQPYFIWTFKHFFSNTELEIAVRKETTI